MKQISLIVFSVFLSLFDVSGQPYHYPFSFDYGGIVNNSLFLELEKDLNRKITFDNTSPRYSYLQHLKNQNYFFSLPSGREFLNREEFSDSLYRILLSNISKFPSQTSGYYYLARFFLNNGDTEQALDVLKEASLDYNISPKSFSYLTQLHAENEKFIQGYNDLMAYYLSGEKTVIPDSRWIALYDSIKEQDQLYRGKYRLDDPRFEKQIEIDGQNASLLRELVLEHGWVTKYLGRDYAFVHIPVMHFTIDDQLFFLDYIIADCKSYKAKWIEAEQVIWKIINHQSMIIIDNERYHSLPLMDIDSLTGIIDLEQSMLAMRSAVLAMFGCGGNRSDIWLVATSEFPEENHMESLIILKKYFVLLGLDEHKIHIQAELLDKEIEDQLIIKTPIVLKLKQ